MLRGTASGRQKKDACQRLKEGKSGWSPESQRSIKGMSLKTWVGRWGLNILGSKPTISNLFLS